MAESEEELKSLVVRVKKSGKAGLKLNIQKTKIWHEFSFNLKFISLYLQSFKK